MTIFDRIATDAECMEPVELTPRAKRQRIGALLLAYGVTEAALLGWMSLMGLQGSDGTEPWLRPTLLMLSIPCCVACVGLGLAGDRRWAYWAAVVLPIAIVPVGAWWIVNPGGRSERLWVELLGPLGGGAFFALGTVALSAALLFTTYQAVEGGS